MIKEITVSTHKRTGFVILDQEIQTVVNQSGIQEGICLLWVPHTTAGVTINENADPSVVQDILDKTGRLIPPDDQYLHMEGNSDAHIKSSLFGPSLTLIITGGKLLLGTWQSIYFCEFDGPRRRRLIIKILEG